LAYFDHQFFFLLGLQTPLAVTHMFDGGVGVVVVVVIGGGKI
jgi:hypothetical protein